MTTLSNAYDLHSKLLNTIGFSKKSFVLMGKLLSELKKNSLYRQAVGEGIDTWTDYLSQPEIGLSNGEANRLVQIYEEFVVRINLSEDYVAEIPIKNLHYLLPIAKGMGADEVVLLAEEAHVLSQRDFRERCWETKIEKTGQEKNKTHEYIIMDKVIETNTMTKVHGIPSDRIKEVFKLG